MMDASDRENILFMDNMATDSNINISNENEC